MWPLIFTINSLRNDLAHQLEPPKFEAKLRAFLEAHLAALESGDWRNLVKGKSIADQLKDAVAFLMGFLGTFEEDAQAYRKLVDSVHKMLNPPK